MQDLLHQLCMPLCWDRLSLPIGTLATSRDLGTLWATSSASFSAVLRLPLFENSKPHCDTVAVSSDRAPGGHTVQRDHAFLGLCLSYTVKCQDFVGRWRKFGKEADLGFGVASKGLHFGKVSLVCARRSLAKKREIRNPYC